MKTRLLLIVLIFPMLLFGQEFTKFRIDNKQKSALLKIGDSDVLMLETYLDKNNESLEKIKYPSIPGVSDVSPFIERIREKATKNKVYKDICIDCYEAEYKRQLEKLSRHGLTDTKGFDVTVMPLFISQDSISILKSYELILAEAKNPFSYHSTKFVRSQQICGITYYDESTRGTDNDRYVVFATSVVNDGNADLEIKGKDVYSFTMAYGNFLDFAGFWIKYINPNITLEELSKNGDRYVFLYNDEKREISLRKQSDENKWLLRNY